jgi:tRNA (uracil-5-)-methyltransferase
MDSVEITKESEGVLDYTNRKVLISNVDKYLKNVDKVVSGWLKGTDAKVIKTKKPPNKFWLIVTLEDENQVQTVIDKINTSQLRNKKGKLLKANRASDAKIDDDNSFSDNKRLREESNSNDSNKRMRSNDIETVKSEEEVKDKLTPLWRSSYEEQLKIKSKSMVQKCLTRIISDIKAKFRTLEREKKKDEKHSKDINPVYSWLQGKRPIEMLPILHAPVIKKYRNKSELNFGYRHQYSEIALSEKDGSENTEDLNRKIIKSPAAGCLAGGWSGGISDVHCLANMPDIVCGIADVFNTFLSTSPIPPYIIKEHRGVWRTVTIRNSERTKQCMVILVHAPPSGGAGKRSDGSDDFSAIFESEKERLVEMLTSKIPKPERLREDENDIYFDYGVTSLYFQEFDGLSHPSPEHPVQHLYGKKYLEEKLLDCEFQISPGAFFQVTTEGAEQLYSVVIDKLKEVTENPKDTVLFDVCCGTGTIGITCAKQGAVGKVIGVDISEPAIADAIINAKRNGFNDGETRFIASRAELVMQEEIHKTDRSQSIVAVVDPAREGLHQDVIRALRSQRRLQRLVYVSCNPTGSLIKDAALLCCPETKKYKGLPFKITYAQPVDMFPFTDHCEMVMVFDRMSLDETLGQRNE